MPLERIEFEQKVKAILSDRSINIDFLRINKEKNLDDLIEGITNQILEAHKATIGEIKKEVNKIDCLDNYYDMSRAVASLVYTLKQKYGGK